VTPRVVFDCVVLFQAAVSARGPAAACLAWAETNPLALAVSDDTVAELRDLLDRPNLRRKFLRLTDESVSAYVGRLLQIAVRIDPVPAAFTLTRDPDDSKYLNLAVAAGANFVVTRDRDLLDLTAGTDADAVAFRTARPTIEILDPVAFLARVLPPTQ
jgi:putative PIN family toxin of toxin-antitoxin system